MAISKKDLERFEKIDLEAKQMYIDGMSLTKIAKHFGIKRDSLSRRLKKKFDLEIKNDNNKCFINSSYFSCIDTEDKAYWLGYILADGCVSGKTFELTSKDYDVIEKFKNSLQSEHKIQIKKINDVNYYRISIRDVDIIEDLKSYGICERKSFTSVKLPVIDGDFYNDFFRGFLDGDGSILKSNIGNKIFAQFTIGLANKELAYEISDFFKSININMKVYYTKTSYIVTTTKISECYKLLDYLYKDATIYMERKYNKYKSLLPS